MHHISATSPHSSPNFLQMVKLGTFFLILSMNNQIITALNVSKILVLNVGQIRKSEVGKWVNFQNELVDPK